MIGLNPSTSKPSVQLPQSKIDETTQVKKDEFMQYSQKNNDDCIEISLNN